MRLNWVVGCAWFIASATIAGEIGQAQSQTDQAGGIALQAETRLANEEAPIAFRNSGLDLHSSSAMVVDQKTGRTLVRQEYRCAHADCLHHQVDDGDGGAGRATAPR